jgi:hypothetical protein
VQFGANLAYNASKALTIEQFWFRPGIGPIFLMNADSVEEAKATVDAMPLVAGGLAKYQLWPVGPLAPLGLLIQSM